MMLLFKTVSHYNSAISFPFFSIKKEDDSQKTVKEVADNFKSLLEKVQGVCFN